jgi:glutamate racemase
MKIGVFDSGLGGLLVLKELHRKLPRYDFLFLGDTKNLPYGNKSPDEIYKLAVRALEYLFGQNCSLVIIACNTISAQALRKIQREWLPKSKYVNRKALGVIKPTVEIASVLSGLVGLIGTKRTIESLAYSREFALINPGIKLVSKTTPNFVPMIESAKFDKRILEESLKSFKNINSLILACTHYGMLRTEIKKIVGPRVKIISQEQLLPNKLKSYLLNHTEIDQRLSKNGKIELEVTRLNPFYEKLSQKWFGKRQKLILVKI